MTSINGIIVPSIMFLGNNSEINSQLNSLLFQHMVLNGASAILLFQTKEEENLLSNKVEQRIQLIKSAFESTEEEVPIIVGVNGDEINYVIDQIDDLGRYFDKLSFVVAPPFSKKLSSNNLNAYFENILSSLTAKNHIYLYNNPIQFSKNEIEPEIVKNLVRFSNLKGFIDASEKLHNYKTNIELLYEDFGVYCSNVTSFSNFLQIIPLELRKFCGIVSSTGNLVNICLKLYNASLEDNILELLQLQELLIDIRNKIYFKFKKGKKFLGLKYALTFLYRDLLSINLDNFSIDLDKTTKDIIEATVKYLVNIKHIYQLYSINKEDLYEWDDIVKSFSKIPILNQQGKLKKFLGPVDGKINTIYRANFENSKQVFRFQTKKSTQFENIVKEKVLFPLLGGLNPNFSKKIREITKIPRGKYLFSKQNPSIIPVANLIYYDETKIILPHNFSITEYIKGKSLNQLVEQYLSENVNLLSQKFFNLFKELGEILAKLHGIKFDSFYGSLIDLGKDNKSNWSEIFNAELNTLIQEANNNKFNYVKEIKSYIKDNEALIEEENEPVVIHNDYSSNNIIVKEESGVIRVKGIIDFDSWRVGVRALDFVEMEYWTLKLLRKVQLYDLFKKSYLNYSNYKFDNDFKKKIEIYSLLRYIKKYNFEIEKNKQLNQDKTQNIAGKTYLNEIEKILNL